MAFGRSASKLAIIILSIFLISSCAAYHKIDGVSDYTQLVLEVGDTVKVTTKNNTKVKLTIHKIDSEYLYGEHDGLTIKKDDIKSLELSRGAKPIMIPLGLMVGLTALSFMFAP